MVNFFKHGYILLLLLCGSANVGAQTIYATGIIPPAGCQLLAVDVQTCEYCVIGPAHCGGSTDLVMYQDGSYATFGLLSNPLRGIIHTFTPPNFDMTITEGPTDSRFDGAVLAANGLVYINGQFNGQPALFSYDPVTQQIEFLGNLPVNFAEIYFIGGVLYGIASATPYHIWQININDPMQSVQVQTLPSGVIPSGVCAVDTLVYIGHLNRLYLYNPSTNSLTQICNFQGLINSFGLTLSAPPPDGPPYVCSCPTSAGTMQGGSLDFCIPQNAAVVHNNNHVLDADDLLQFILYSNPADPTGSIIATAATPSFSFAAPLQPGVPYYIAAIAGNNVNGNVDLNDPCLDVSDGVEVTWHPQPSVVFSAAETDVCAGGCRTVNATFTGTPPFSLTVNTPAGVLTEFFSGHTGSFQVCPPPGTPPGAFSVQATALTDAFCSCN